MPRPSNLRHCWLAPPDAISMFVIVIPFVSADVPQGPADRHLLLEHARSNGVDLRIKFEWQFK